MLAIGSCGDLSSTVDSDGANDKQQTAGDGERTNDGDKDGKTDSNLVTPPDSNPDNTDTASSADLYARLESEIEPKIPNYGPATGNCNVADLCTKESWEAKKHRQRVFQASDYFGIIICFILYWIFI